MTKLNNSLLVKAGGLAVATVTRHWMGTLDCHAAYYDPTADPVHPNFRGPVIYIFWHEYIAFPFYARGHCNIAMLLSRHRDAEWLSHAAYHMGFQTVRGSTFRGGSTALLELFRKSRRTNLTITPDGPRGPRRSLAQGPIYLSSKLGIPLVALGCGYDRPWRLRTWDRFAVPRPFSRARTILSPKVQIPPNLDRDGIEHYRQRIERLLQRLTVEAEAWARAGTHKVNQSPFYPQTRLFSSHVAPPQDPCSQPARTASAA